MISRGLDELGAALGGGTGVELAAEDEVDTWVSTGRLPAKLPRPLPLPLLPRPRAARFLPPGGRIAGSGVSSPECTVICERAGDALLFDRKPSASSTSRSSPRMSGGTVPSRTRALGVGVGEPNAGRSPPAALVPASMDVYGPGVRTGDSGDSIPRNTCTLSVSYYHYYLYTHLGRILCTPLWRHACRQYIISQRHSYDPEKRYPRWKSRRPQHLLNRRKLFRPSKRPKLLVRPSSVLATDMRVKLVSINGCACAVFAYSLLVSSIQPAKPTYFDKDTTEAE